MKQEIDSWKISRKQVSYRCMMRTFNVLSLSYVPGLMSNIVFFPDQLRPLIVGSVGPYGASLHDASEYTGSYADTTSKQTMRQWHLPRISALVEAGVDLLALETIPCRAEAEMLVELIKEFPTVKAWLSFSCNVSILETFTLIFPNFKLEFVFI